MRHYSLIDWGKKPSYSQEKADKIVLITNVGEKSQTISELYKFRNGMEESFFVFKNRLQVDTPYLRDDYTIRSYVLLSFISLIAYYRILKLLKTKKIHNIISAKGTPLQLSKIYFTDVGDRTIMAETQKKARELAEILEPKRELFPKSVPI